MNKYLKMTRDGFTLVELMVVVAIIGVLASIAVPQYSKFQAKARQSEVRIQLGAAYTVEQTFAAENSTYTGCLGNVGYNRDGTKFYYTLGFASGIPAGTVNCGPGLAAGTCLNTQWSYSLGAWAPVATSACADGAQTTVFLANIAEPNVTGSFAPVLPVQTQLAGGSFTTAVNSTVFTIGATATIHAKSTHRDEWTMDQNKQILNTLSGLN